MTDEELKNLAASLIESGKETDRRMQETDRQMQETDRRMQETDRRIQETDRIVKENALSIKETDRLIKELSRRMGGIDENQGHHAEQYFQNAFAEKPVFGGITYDAVVPNLAYKDRNGEIEFDIALINGNSIALIEVKNRIHSKFVKQFAEERVKKFREYFPKYKKFKTRLGIAGFSFSEKVMKEARKYGIGLIRQVGDSVEIRAEKLKVY
jgi:chromosome segregation ATPase